MFILFLPSLLHIVFNNKQRCKVVWYCNYPFLAMNSFLLSLPNYTVCVSFCLREKESQVSVPWAFLCLSLKTDGWRSASVSLASPVALDNNTLPRRSGGSEQMGGCGWRGFLKEKKKKARWEVEEDTAVEIHMASVFKSKQHTRSQKKCLIVFFRLLKRSGCEQQLQAEKFTFQFKYHTIVYSVCSWN